MLDGDAQRQQRDQRAVMAALLAASGPATPSIAPVLPNSAACSARTSFFLGGVAEEGGDRAAGRDGAERKADEGAAQPGRLPQERRHSCAVMCTFAHAVLRLGRAALR